MLRPRLRPTTAQNARDGRCGRRRRARAHGRRADRRGAAGAQKTRITQHIRSADAVKRRPLFLYRPRPSTASRSDTQKAKKRVKRYTAAQIRRRRRARLRRRGGVPQQSRRQTDPEGRPAFERLPRGVSRHSECGRGDRRLQSARPLSPDSAGSGQARRPAESRPKNAPVYPPAAAPVGTRNGGGGGTS